MKRNLTDNAIRAVREVRNGASKQYAYRKYILTPYDEKNLKKTAIAMKAQRFFELPEIKEAREMSEQEFEKIDPDKNFSESNAKELNKAINKLNELADAELSPEQLFFNSLSISKDRPDEIILTGTAKLVLKHAIGEIQRRAYEIKEKGIDALDKNASVFTTSNVAALRLGTSILENRTERYLTTYQSSNTMALELLNRTVNSFDIDPEEYTAPIPNTALEGRDDK